MVAGLSRYPADDSTQSAFRTTVISGRRDHSTRASKGFIDVYDRAREILALWRRSSRATAVPMGQDKPETHAYINRMFETFDYMRFCTTEKGYMGLCTLNARVGDVVYILHGMHTPYTMRRATGSDTGHLKLFGECYIHGIIDGEALELPGYEPRGGINMVRRRLPVS